MAAASCLLFALHSIAPLPPSSAEKWLSLWIHNADCPGSIFQFASENNDGKFLGKRFWEKLADFLRVVLAIGMTDKN